RAGLRPLAVDVDAHSGEVVGVRDNRCSGAGNLLWNGVALPFATGKGKGNVYGSVTNAAAGKESGVALTELTLQDVNQDSLSLTGTLTGRYASVADTHAVLYSPERSFPFSDSSSAAVGPIAQYEAFDHVNAYYWITRMAGWLGKLQGGLSSDTCLPVYVNYDQGGEGFINAFYSPQDLDGDGEGAGWSAGYFVFGDFDAVTGDPADDFARDPSVVCHEYTHAMVDKAGFTFGDGELDTPSRAINEAIADYAAASFLGDARIGHVFVAHSGDDLGIPGDALRDLSAPLTLADDLFDTLGSSTDMPEEHEAGRIFGAALWSARAALKAKVADDLVLNGLAGWPQSNAEAGFPVVDADNAQDAYTAFAFACFDSMMEDLLASGPAGARNAGKLLGAFLEHGLTGTGDDSVLFTFPLAEGGLSLDVASAFRGVLGSHRFALELAAGQQLSVAVTGLKADGTQVDFALQGAPGALGFPKPKKSAVTGASASQSQITVNQSGTCVLTVANTGATAGRYTLKLKVK
ncbi:MAG TPA: hypothetical protein VK824_07380, partial [Planctomycetota bacterium]|nr:hypothetical protein [Planctomycetota bacterium]